MYLRLVSLFIYAKCNLYGGKICGGMFYCEYRKCEALHRNKKHKNGNKVGCRTDQTLNKAVCPENSILHGSFPFQKREYFCHKSSGMQRKIVTLSSCHVVANTKCDCLSKKAFEILKSDWTYLQTDRKPIEVRAWPDYERTWKAAGLMWLPQANCTHYSASEIVSLLVCACVSMSVAELIYNIG